MFLRIRLLCFSVLCAVLSGCVASNPDPSAEAPTDDSSVQSRGTIKISPFERPSPQLNLSRNLLVGANPGHTAYLYGIMADGGALKWYRHNGVDTVGGGIGPQDVGTEWHVFKQVLPSGGNFIYSIAPNGVLRWYGHTGFVDGTFTWAGPKEVGIGWQNFKQVVAGSEGILYAIAPDGKLLWYRHRGYKEGNWDWAGPTQVGIGWQVFKHVFGGCQGVLYAITPDGMLKWYKHTGYQDGTNTWQGPTTVGTADWHTFTQVFSTCDGNVYALKPNGTLKLYRHTGYATGQATWEGPTDTWIGLPNFLTMFALLQYTPPPAPPSVKVDLNVLTYNIYMKPTSISRTWQAQRGDLLPAYLHNYEVIIFNEAFDDDIRAKLISALTPVYPHRTTILGSDRVLDQDGGVIIVSKWPIIDEKERLFRLYGNPCTGFDCNADKGVKYAKVCKEGYPFHIFGTHTNAKQDSQSFFARYKQFQILRQFVDDMKIPSDEPVIIGGDMNVPKVFPSLSTEYQYMLDALGAKDPSGDGPPFLDQRAYPDRPYCTYCYGFNALAEDEEDGQTILDYVLYSVRHKAPSKATIWFQQPRTTEPWMFNLGKFYSDLSDHFPQLGKFQFEFPAAKRC